MIRPSHQRRYYEMASKRSHYEDVSIRDNSRVHLGDSFSELFDSPQGCLKCADQQSLTACADTLEAQNLGGTRIATQTSQQTVHGDLNIYL